MYLCIGLFLVDNLWNYQTGFKSNGSSVCSNMGYFYVDVILTSGQNGAKISKNAIFALLEGLEN